MSVPACPRCGHPRQGDTRYCTSCAFDYERSGGGHKHRPWWQWALMILGAIWLGSVVLVVAGMIVLDRGGLGGGIQTIGFDTGSGCQSSDSATSFSTDDPVHFVALFEPELQADDDITVTVTHDGQRHLGLSSELTLEEPTGCIEAALGRLDPGQYGVTVSSRIGTNMSPLSGDFEVTGERLDRAAVGEVWFGSSYDLETFEIDGRTDSVELDAPLAFVTQLPDGMAPAEVMLRLSHEGEVFQHDKVDVEGTDASRYYGFAGTAPPEPGTWTFDFTDTDGNVLATGEVEVTASASGSASESVPPSHDASPEQSAAPSPTSEGELISAYDLEVGDCYGESAEDEELLTVMIVDCEQPHVFEVFRVFDHEAGPDAEYPGDDEILEYADEACRAPFEEFVDHDYDTSVWYISWVTPSAESWAESDREIVCTLATEDYDEVSGSAEGSAR